MKTCRLCGNREGNQRFEIREMLHGTREVFAYLRCASCEALQIEEIPTDLGRFYPPDYYSYQVQPRSRLRDWLKHKAARDLVSHDSPLGAILTRVFEAPELLTRVARSGVGFDARILEIGSGAGKNLLDLWHMGFHDVTGVDPYLPEPILHDEGVTIHKCEASRLDAEFDLVLLNDVFEHLPDPLQMLRDCRGLLAPQGTLLLRTPVADSHAWREYGVDWVQIDAPRHLHVHTRKSLELLASRAGLAITDRLWDSTAFQFWGSEQYRRDIPIRDAHSYAENPHASPFSRAQMREFREQTARLNEQGQGDAACFYLRRQSSEVDAPSCVDDAPVGEVPGGKGLPMDCTAVTR